MIATPSNPGWWLTRDGVAHAAVHLRGQFAARYPKAAQEAPNNPGAVCDYMPDLELELQGTPPRGACPVGAVYSPEPPPARIVMRLTGTRRDGFTVLHEVGHHLMYRDDVWSLNVRPSLPEGKDRILGEKAANAFAASVLLQQDDVEAAFAGGVSAAAIRGLYRTTQASATACCVSGLGQPGERLVMLSEIEGRPWFADSHGTPFNPGIKLTQPLITHAVANAGAKGTARITGGQGIVYSTGRTDTDVILDIAVDGGYVFVVVTSAPHDPRVTLDLANEVLCGHCDEVFDPGDSAGRCEKCSTWPCPACGQCDCERPASYCQKCFIQLPVADVRAGHTSCEEHR